MKLPESVELIEVCPRDGFQNVHDLIPFDAKVAIIKKLAEAGFKRIEAVSFVSPKAIPQMADAKDVMLAVKDTLKTHGVRSVALVPNARGVETALECGVDELTYVVSVSEKHNMANVRRTPDESLAQFKELAGKYGHQMRFRLALATALGCPFGEEIRTERVAEMVRFGLDQGCKEVMIADTVGMSNPKRTYDLMEALVKEFGPERFVMHLHDTRGLALANTLACMELGVHKFESAAGGLGGCPFAPGAAGNVATEDVLNMMSEMGVATGIDNDVLHEAVELIQANVHANIVSHMTPLYKKAPCV
ncbi:hydroxymethylglutaryl-CoA lyase [uncultured Oscillibacter sp.]|uniref:hydroxymethylglutaryl-CoA lyase n=1 Tax=uncultured Oscillibacter sp. TaxID=876091 RepID=UPI0025FC4F8D|nr:hydroxymethylglutaryl-CoA lyase [uncultured Oscillibacter sp.]